MIIIIIIIIINDPNPQFLSKPLIFSWP